MDRCSLKLLFNGLWLNYFLSHFNGWLMKNIILCIWLLSCSMLGGGCFMFNGNYTFMFFFYLIWHFMMMSYWFFLLHQRSCFLEWLLDYRCLLISILGDLNVFGYQKLRFRLLRNEYLLFGFFHSNMLLDLSGWIGFLKWYVSIFSLCILYLHDCLSYGIIHLCGFLNWLFYLCFKLKDELWLFFLVLFCFSVEVYGAWLFKVDLNTATLFNCRCWAVQDCMWLQWLCNFLLLNHINRLIFSGYFM